MARALRTDLIRRAARLASPPSGIGHPKLPGVALVLLSLALTACGNPRANPDPPRADHQPASDAPQAPRPAERVLLQPVYAPGRSFRTTRTLRVEELTATERYLTESSEITLTRVLQVDEAGRLLAVQRTWEQSLTRLTRGFGSPEEARGDLHGSTLELRRRQGGVSAEVISGEAGIGRQTFLLDGFDTALLPLDPVAQGARWQLDAGQLAGLNRFIEAIGYSIEKNRLQCVLAVVTPESAEIVLDWQISGDLKGRTAVLVLTGKLTFDRRQRLVRELLIVGTRGGETADQQLEIRVTRRLTDGWLDLDG